MATNLAIDDDLLNLACRLGGRRTKKETVNDALREYLQRRKRLKALRFVGGIDLDRWFDHKQERRRR